MIYRNTKTGAVVKSDCVISGNGWEPIVEAKQDNSVQTEEPKSVEAEQDVERKRKARKGKK